MSCEVCQSTINLTKHHLIPEVFKPIGISENLWMPTERMILCRSCHDELHNSKSNLELKMKYYTKESVITLLKTKK